MDYVRDAGEAQKIKEQYKLSSATDKDLVIFDCDGHVKIVNGDALYQTELEQIPNENPNDKEPEFRRKPVAFNGEMVFTAMLLAVENPKPLKAYFLQGDGEPSLSDSGEIGLPEIRRGCWRKITSRPSRCSCRRRRSRAGRLQPAHHRRTANGVFGCGTAED